MRWMLNARDECADSLRRSTVCRGSVKGYRGKNGRHGRRAAKEVGRPPGDYLSYLHSMDAWGQQRGGPGFRWEHAGWQRPSLVLHA
jgi:hypothetical protein